jgi:hypothetical protein
MEAETELSAAETGRSEAELLTRADNFRADNFRADNFRADKADHREVVMALLSPAAWAAMRLNRARRAEVMEAETELSAAETEHSEPEMDPLLRRKTVLSAAETERLDMEMERLDAE